MKPTHIEHIGIAVNSIAEALPFYEKVLGLKCYNIEEVADQKVKTAFFMIGQTNIAFAVDRIEERLREAEAAGIRLIDSAPRKGAEGLSIAFLHPKSTFGVLTELCEDKNKENNK